MPNTLNNPSDNSSLIEPYLIVKKKTTEFYILGTAHVSKQSAEEVARLVATENFNALAIEVCPSRLASLQDPNSLAKMDLFQVIKQGKAGMVAANLALGSFQQRLAEQSGIRPGEEMLTAIKLAKENDLPLIAIDRDLGITLKRVYKAVPWWQRAALLMGLFTSLFSKEKISPEEIEKLKQGDLLEATFAEFAAESKHLYTALIDERDEYMALKLAQTSAEDSYNKVLVVIGAGHLQGIKNYLTAEEEPEAAAKPSYLAKLSARLKELTQLPPPNKLLKALPWALVGVILLGFALAFNQNTQLGWSLVLDWVLINGGLSALGVLLAAGHPLTVLTAFVAAPITSLNPTIGAGFVCAAAEIYLRKPTVEDFANLRQHTSKLSGWWRNRVARTLLVFILSTLGSAIGTYVAGFKIFQQVF